MKRLSIFILLFILSFISPQLFAETPDKTLPTNEASIHLGNDTKIKTTSLHQTFPDLKTTIKASYPQIISKASLSSAEEQFNQLIQDRINNEINEFKKYVKEDLDHMQSLPKEVQKNYLSIDYDIDVIHPNQQTIVMVRLNIEGMQAGRAHPYHTHRVFNYNLTKNKLLSLGDLFKPKTDYLKMIAEYSRKQLLEKSTDQSIVEMIKQGTQVNAKNFQNWNIQNDTLLITFDEYQVAPYVNGPQEVEIPYSALKNIIDKDSVIYSCIADPKSCGLS